jgi:hypothetical protein
MVVLPPTVLAEAAFLFTSRLLSHSFRHSDDSYTGKSISTIAGNRSPRKYRRKEARALYHNEGRVEHGIAERRATIAICAMRRRADQVHCVTAEYGTQFLHDATGNSRRQNLQARALRVSNR